jgi:glucokinase
MDYAIGIDLGGTNIKAVAVARDGDVVERSTCATADDGTGMWAERVRSVVRTLQGSRGELASAIGIATPGLPAPGGRSIASVSGRLRQLHGLDWTEYLGTHRSVPVLNDAQAALLGEAWLGAAAGRRHVLMLTLGTGVGGAIMADGRLMRGHLGRAGEVGHISLQFDGPSDSLGIPGSLETAIGNSTVSARSGGRYSSTRDLVEAHRAGEPAATEVWTRSVYQLACAIASLINIVDPELIIIGGGIAAAGPDLFEPLQQYLEAMEWRPYGVHIPIVPATLGDFAGAIGAARNALLAGVEVSLR